MLGTGIEDQQLLPGIGYLHETKGMLACPAARCPCVSMQLAGMSGRPLESMSLAGRVAINADCVASAVTIARASKDGMNKAIWTFSS